MLEDDYTDVLRKAMIGMGLEGDELAARAGISPDDWKGFAGGDFSAEAARSCAQVLGLKVEAMVAHPSYHPQPIEVPSLRRLMLPFGAYDVNAWWVSGGSTGLLFDLGFEAPDLIDRLPRKPDGVFITHAHRDHVGALDWALSEGMRVVSADSQAGMEWAFGSLTIRSVDLSGHCTPQVGYFIDGLECRLLVLGDALFAGSMGRCASPDLFRHALQRLHDVLDPMPDDLILLPGHGPATTLGEERQSNPFL